MVICANPGIHHSNKGQISNQSASHNAFKWGFFSLESPKLSCLDKRSLSNLHGCKKLSVYLANAYVLLCSDNLPLKKFLHKVYLSAKVKNQGVDHSDPSPSSHLSQGSKTLLVIYNPGL